ncbi:hypothetical protein JVU11DRAFT_2083 [Chiua virens]|nr:hypothetical protein JVU11DRAFT_2083 [Chiua virens]
MAAVHVYGNGRSLGWYNNPGSFQIAKRFRSFAKRTSSNVSSKSQSQITVDPTTLFELDACKGPKFRAAHSGTVISETGYLAALLMKECAAWDSEGKVVPGRRTQPVGITYRRSRTDTYLPDATGTSSVLGIVASGVSCLVLGSADFAFTHPEPAKGSPAGDGILMSNKDIILLKGSESAVNSITRGSFSLPLLWRVPPRPHPVCITQLLLISQASLFGQIMFLTSLGVSALYNTWLSSLDKDNIHRKLLFDKVLENPTFAKYTLGTRTTAVVFMLLVLRLQDATTLLDELLPNDTKVWKQWKATILGQLRRPSDKPFLDDTTADSLEGFTEQEKALLELLYDDARAAYKGYEDYLRIDSL